MTVSSKGIGKDDIRTRLNESLMNLFHPIRMLKIPGFRGITGDQSEQKQIGTHRSIQNQISFGFQFFQHACLFLNQLRKVIINFHWHDIPQSRQQFWESRFCQIP